MKICAIVVTFNRLTLLKETLKNLNNQDRKLDGIIVVNNASTDGTKEYLDNIKSEDVTIYNLDKNLGGAGGFSYGIKKAYENNFDLIWIMDDDTLVTKDALSKLLNGFNKLTEYDKKIGFLASNVLFKDNKPCLMNIPKTSEVWNELAAENLIKVDYTSFVSVLIPRTVIKEVGLPIKEFFIWGDDVEYTMRISEKFEGYMVTDSIVNHYMNENNRIDIIKTENNRIDRYFYEYRNSFFINRKKGILGIIKFNIYVFKSLLKVLLSSNKYKAKKIYIILKGFINGVVFNPKIEGLD